MTTEEQLAEVNRKLGLPSTSPLRDTLVFIDYMNQLIHKMSLPGLREQAPSKYCPDQRHIQDLPRIGNNNLVTPPTVRCECYCRRMKEPQGMMGGPNCISCHGKGYYDLVKNCCPICGYEFDEVREVNECPTSHAEGPFTPDELITSDDDYAWCI